MLCSRKKTTKKRERKQFMWSPRTCHVTNPHFRGPNLGGPAQVKSLGPRKSALRGLAICIRNGHVSDVSANLQIRHGAATADGSHRNQTGNEANISTKRP